MSIVAPSTLLTHKPSRTAKFRAAFVEHVAVRWAMVAGSKSSPGTSQPIHQVANYPFFTPPQNVGYALFVDIDRPGAVLDFYSLLPEPIQPSWVIETPHGAQAGWFIDPVNLSDTGRDHPIRYARNIGKALRTAVGGDTQVDPLTPSRVRNPAYEHAGTFAAPTPPIYKLGQLYEGLKAANLWNQEATIDTGRPTVQPTKGTISTGTRNNSIFNAARFVAYAGGDFTAEAWAANDRCNTPLGASEVHQIIASISRFMADKGRPHASGGIMPMPDSMREALSEMGRRGGLRNSSAQQAARAKGPAAAAASRKKAAYEGAKHAQRLHRQGHTRAQIAAQLGRAACTVRRYLRRWIPIPLAEMLACITGASGEVLLSDQSGYPAHWLPNQSRGRLEHEDYLTKFPYPHYLRWSDCCLQATLSLS